MNYTAACHCGAVKMKVVADEHVTAHACNCSICKKGNLRQIIVPARDFELISGEDQLTLYQFNTCTARHYFCKICGIKPFYIPRSNPDGYAINVDCLDPQPVKITIEYFDGVNWEQNAESLADYSK